MRTRQRLTEALAHRWPLVHRVLPARRIPYPVRGGWAYLSLRNAPTGIQRLLRVYEPQKYVNIARFLPRGGGFVDVGANSGDFAIWAARVAGPDARVLAIEAEPDNAHWLRRTIERNNLTNQVSVVQVAAATETGQTELILTNWNGTHSIVESELHEQVKALRPRGRVTVETRTLDSLIADAGLPRVDIVKIDVEGAELLVLGGASELLGSAQPLVLLIDLHFGVDFDELARLLQAHDFTIRLEDHPDDVVTTIPKGTLSIVAVRSATSPAAQPLG